MQQAQENCFLALAFLVLGTVLAPSLATAAGGSDPLLAGAQGPCEARPDSPDYAAGTDVNGNPVVPADLASAKAPVPDDILVPLGSGRGRSRSGQPQALADLNQKELDSVLNPKPACPPARTAQHRVRR